ncbi:MAG: homoserine O-acetyltransferase [Cytophagales bacterium]
MESKIFKYDEDFQLEGGGVLQGFQLQYSTWGKINENRDNIIWVCHALTGNSLVSEWWDGLVGEGKLYNPKDHFIICANVLGSCYGSTGPHEINPLTKKLYYLDFPDVTIRDMVKALDILRQALHIEHINTLLGGSLGGQQAMEWAISKPELHGNLILMATNAQHSPWGIAFNETQRMAIKADPTWKNESKDAGHEGLKAARAIGMLSYRNYEAYWNTQLDSDIEKLDHYKASSYQLYQGQKLVERFNTHAYMCLSKAMDSHHVGRGRGNVKNALKLIKSKTLVIGISSDFLFPVSEQKFLAENISNAQYVEIDSFYGHDGFLVEFKAITEVILDWLQQ